jgi:hypothetical protein
MAEKIRHETRASEHNRSAAVRKDASLDIYRRKSNAAENQNAAPTTIGAALD